MDIKKVREYCDGKPLNCLHSPAIGDKRVANAKWRPLGGAEW